MKPSTPAPPAPKAGPFVPSSLSNNITSIFRFIPALFNALGSSISAIIQGVTTGESLNSILAPFLFSLETLLRKLPFVEALIIKFLLKKDLVLEGVKLPVDSSSSINHFLTLTGTSQFMIVKFLATSLSDITSIVGLTKTDPKAIEIFEEYHRDYVKFAVAPKGPYAVANTLPEDYRYFGNGKNLENLPYFFKSNPFFIASVRSKPDSTFEIDPFGKSGSTYFSDLIACLDNSAPRVAATFDSKMNIKEMRVFNAQDPNKELTGISKEKAATLLLYQCSYYAQNIHATTHIFHLLLTTGMVHSTKGTALSSWSKPYMANIYLKYIEVETLLFSKSGYLTGSRPGSTGYPVSNRDKVLKINKAMLCEWGTYKTSEDYITKFLFKNITLESLIKSGIAQAFFSQTDLVTPYAIAMNEEFKKDPNFNQINSKLKAFLLESGKGVCDVDNMQTWVELLSVTGILHGSTLSMSRLVLTHSFLSVNSPESTKFVGRDAAWMAVITGTVLGCLDDFHVFSNTLPSNTPYNINRVLLEFDNKTNDLKAKYFKKISEDAEVFKNFGWILTDHGPNFLDGKQLTITTYI